jgi:hypothetical protein
VAVELKTDERIVVWGRRALVLVVVGLVLQIGASFHWTPATFILSAAIGLPCVLLGAAVFAWSVLRARIREGGRGGEER